jgi:hypothetical protein
MTFLQTIADMNETLENKGFAPYRLLGGGLTFGLVQKIVEILNARDGGVLYAAVSEFSEPLEFDLAVGIPCDFSDGYAFAELSTKEVFGDFE